MDFKSKKCMIGSIQIAAKARDEYPNVTNESALRREGYEKGYSDCQQELQEFTLLDKSQRSVASDSTDGETLVRSSDYAKLQQENERLREAFDLVLSDYWDSNSEYLPWPFEAFKSEYYRHAGLSNNPQTNPESEDQDSNKQ